MKATLRKAEKFSFRLTREQKQMLRQAAEKRGTKPGTLVRDLVLREIGPTAPATAPGRAEASLA